MQCNKNMKSLKYEKEDITNLCKDIKSLVSIFNFNLIYVNVLWNIKSRSF